VLGVVRIADSRRVPVAVLRRYLRGYKSGTEGEHHHVHGANMGFRADAYWKVGGFRALPTGEDVELVERFEAAGYQICRDPALSVATSARSQGRAPGGFAAHLRKLSRPAARDSA
jgi:GT2 family glycosyltransferase